MAPESSPDNPSHGTHSLRVASTCLLRGLRSGHRGRAKAEQTVYLLGNRPVRTNIPTWLRKHTYRFIDVTEGDASRELAT